jgi:hypothetical membrane protein
MNLRGNKLAGYLTLVGVSQFLLSMTISEAIYPNYSIKSNYISDLGVGSTAIIFNTSIIIMEILVIISLIMLIKNLFWIILSMVRLGSTIVDVFPENTGVPHLISALIAFLFGIALV